jgi:release factor glutamine methyltransferase
MKLLRPSLPFLRRDFVPPADCCPEVESALASAALLLEAAGVETGRLDAECLLAAALGQPRWQLLLEPRRRLRVAEFARYLALLQRREQREPLAYILEKREFWSVELRVSTNVLVPRPETETLVEAALAVWRRGTPTGAPGAGRRAPGDEPRATSHEPLIVDLCTGTGAVAIALACEIPTARLLATDVSAQAIRLAQENVAAHGLSARIRCLCGDLWRAVNGQMPAGADLVVANPPYVRSGAMPTLMPEVGWEPRVALDGGPDGLRVIREIIATTPDRLRLGGWLLLEIGDEQAESVLALMTRTGRFEDARVVPDLAGRPRVVAARRCDGPSARTA